MMKRPASSVPIKEIVSQIRTNAKKIGLFGGPEIQWHESCKFGPAMKKQLKTKSKKQTKTPIKIERAPEARSPFGIERPAHSLTGSFGNTPKTPTTPKAPTAGESYQNDLPELVRSDIPTTD